ncbi:MAG: FG-GAP-like repeat-containing protein, partial [Thermoanaerobaculia bacterium]|nr:FG-GAP-like repeat-containing protein [Thermoanaerobaculia bacterium]
MATILLALGGVPVVAQEPYVVDAIQGFSTISVGRFASPNLVDFDGDGDLDIVAGSDSGKVEFIENTGSTSSPSFQYPVAGFDPFDGVSVFSRSAPEMADLDGDGDLDAIVGNIDTRVRYFENTGSSSSPSFAQVTGTNNPFFSISAGYTSRTALGDLDGDGDLDLILGGSYAYGIVPY